MAIIDTTTPLSQGLAKVFQASAQPSFELNYNRLQNSLINRLNDQIDEIANDPGPIRAQEALARKMKTVQQELPLITDYITGNEHNAAKLETLSESVTAMKALFSRDDDDTNLTADEAADINAARDDIVTKLQDLYIISHPDVTDGNVIGRLKDHVATLESLTATAGVVDAAGTTPATNDNRELLDFMDQLATDVGITLDVTSNTITMSLEMKLDLLAKYADYETQSTELTVVEAERRTREIDDLKIENANLLKAISLSFETANYLSESLGSALQQPVNPPGSVMNLFT